MSAYSLKYTFQALFNDGSIYKQNADDTPQIADHGSAFTDVKDRLDDIQQFGLFLEDQLVCLVDLTSGKFLVNGVVIKTTGPTNTPPDCKYRLIYFRHVTRHFSGADEIGIAVEYHIGWQTTVDGKNYQQTIAVD